MPNSGDSPTDFHIVGIGASAGGLEAFLDLLRALPPRPGMALVFIQHLEPHYASQLPEILSRSTELSVVRAEEGQRVERDHVYVIPPNTVMVIENGTLHLAPRSESAKPNYPIDLFFESLAADQGANAIGIVLSGSASDGAHGIRAIKSRFGTTFCQDERSAKYGGMPNSAIATGAVDFVLPPEKIAVELGSIDSHPYLTTAVEKLEHPVADAEAEGEIQKILDHLKSATKVDFSQYKLSTVRRRLGRRLAVHHIGTLREYLEHLDRHPAEIHDLYRDLLINVTSFFREPEMFQALETAIPTYLETRATADPFRVWTPGCSTGEETYSLAIVVCEILDRLGKDLPVQVFGTDISDSAIDRARSGVFAEKIGEELSPERLQQYFSRVDSGFRIKQQIRENCVFARHDLTSDPPFSQLDLVSCRNVFIYLNSGLQQRVLPLLHYSLKPGGLLVLGSAETVGSRTDLFGVIDSESKIYRKRPARIVIDQRASRSAEQNVPAPPPHKPVVPINTVLDLETRAARILRDLYAPAGFLIDSDLQVLQLHGQTDSYVERPPGEAGGNLLRLVRVSLVHPLRSAVETAMTRKEPAHERVVLGGEEDRTRAIELSVIPLSNEADFCMVLFEEDSRDGAKNGPAQERVGEPTAAELQFGHLQRELAQTKDYLRKVIEEHEATTEELRAAIEESRSANEELQSTNEELRTAKEQLQSSNEELTTVNDELKHSNVGLNLASNDLSNLLSAATIPMVMVGMDLRLRRFTPSAERLLDMVPGDIGRTITEVRYPFELPYLKDMLSETLRTLNVQQRRARGRDGRWYNVFVRPYRTLDDRIDGAVITFIDIDDATRALAQAEQARDLAERIVETVQHPLLLLDHNLRVARATGAFYRTFDVRPEDTIGQAIDDLGNGQWRIAELRRLLEQALQHEAPFRDLEITHEFPNLGVRTMRLNARRLPATDTEYSLLLAIEDVTDRREVAEIQYRRLFESAKDGIVVLDGPSGTVLDVNPYFLELTRYSRADLLNKPLHETPPFLDVEVGRRMASETATRGTVRYDSVSIRSRDGREPVVEVIANSYRVRDQFLIQINIRDVTEKRRREEELRRSNLDLQQFAFAASHDLQEPLRTITSYLELLQRQYESKLGPEADEQIRFVTSAADHMRQLVLDLLGFSQVARAEMNRSEVSVEAALSTVLLNLQMAIQSSRARITFDPLPAVYADETQVIRLLQNLIANSIKYRGEDVPAIHLSAQQAGDEWILSVQDNGIGIDMRYADHIFSVFKRLHGREYPGTGIGLAICKRIVERHGGQIWVESKPGKGSTFHFTLQRAVKHK